MTTTMRTLTATAAVLLVALLMYLWTAVGSSASNAYEAPRPGRPAPQAQLWCTRDVPCPGDGGGTGLCVKGGGYPPKCY